MRICLVMPLETHNPDLAKLSVGEIMEPLGLSYIAANVRQAGHEVCIVDRRIMFMKSQYNLEKLDKNTIDTIVEFKADYVGFYLNVVLINDVFHLSNILKNELLHIKIIVGGPQVTLFRQDVISRIPNADIYSSGEGEITTLEILDGKPLEEILGIAYRCEAGIKVNPARPLIEDLDVLPLPARDLLDTEFYFNPDKNILVEYSKSYNGDNPRMAEILTSRGCTMQCSFCACPKIWDKRVRYHSSKRVVEDINDVIAYGANFAYFNDDFFTMNKKKAIQICDELISSGMNKKMQWVAQSRPEVISKEILLAMKAAGCVRVEFGFESGSQRMLNIMNKNTLVKQYVKTIEMVKEVGLAIQANIIFGFPGERKEDVIETIEFLHDTKPESVLLNAFQPIPGTESYKTILEKGYKLNDSFIPAHPFLTPYNFTDMDDNEYKTMFWRLMECAPEALNYYLENKELFCKVSNEFNTAFAPCRKSV